ncbi:MAG: hypothetical protein QME12_00990 [Nanoarchaeota archaeon]|nr:hypothetical protein [Nanoarchaeota archaeon]
MRLKISPHALGTMVVKGIDEEMIRRAIKQGAISKQTDGLLARYTYVEVAYKTRGDLYIIKTVKVVN